MQRTFAARFLGVGNAHAADLGCSACVIERGEEPLLLIDCGVDIPASYTRTYPQQLPSAIFITHPHLDHIGGLENLFYRAYFDPRPRGNVKLFVPVKIVELLHQRVADYPNILAEGGANFWDCFHLIPVSDRFWYDNLMFTVFPVRHHGIFSAFGIALEGVFLYTGDTRPIPEVINSLACRGEVIFHDGCVVGNPSHTGISEVRACYKPEQLQRMIFYHYGSEAEGTCIETLGYQIARRGARILLGGGESWQRPAAEDALPTDNSGVQKADSLSAG